MKKDIEQQLKETLGNRSIAPSADAWERLAMNRQRTRKDNTNKKKAFFYYAAAVAVLFLVGDYAFFILNEKPAAPVAAPQVADTKEPAQVVPAETNAATQKGYAVKAENPALPAKRTIALAEAAVTKEKIQQAPLAIENTGVTNANDAQLAAKVVVPYVPVSKDAEAESLLANATKGIALSKQEVKATNDTALLKEVEAEMDDYYRDKAMKVFALKHKTIRFAVNKQ